jgi:hypothetical protein
MSRSLYYLRRGLFGIAFVGSLGFGATQAFGSPNQARVGYCTPMGYDYHTPACGSGCYRGIGYCSEGGICRCGQIP